MTVVVSKKIKIFYGLLFVVMVGLLYVFYNNSQKIKSSSDLVEHTLEVIHVSDNVLIDMVNMETSLRGFMLTNNKLFLDPFYAAEITINENLFSLQELIKDNPVQQARVASLQNMAEARLAFIQNFITSTRVNTLLKENTTEVLYNGKMVMDKARTIISEFKADEFALLRERKLASDTSSASLTLVYGALFAFIVAIFVLIIVFIQNQFNKAKDVSELKESSLYTRSLIEASLDPLVTINAQGKITDVNQASIKITGILRDGLIGTDFFSYFIETEKAGFIYEQVLTKGSVIDSPLTIRHTNGALINVLFNGSAYRDSRGNIVGVVVVARDMTEQNRIKDELVEAKENAEKATQKAEESNRLKEAFLANMSHEIRTPMNAIIGFSDILSKRSLGDEERDFVLTIKAAGENLLTIINDILDISKIEAGMMTFENHRFSVKEIFASLGVMLTQKAKEKGLELAFNCDEEVPAVLIGDNTRLTQIVINLVGNAIKFTKSGKIEVRAKVIDNTKNEVIVEFLVKDTGIGIPKDKLANIFERFMQAESHTTRKYGGTGLGLSIAKRLAELQGGSLVVKSTLGLGSVFSFCITYEKSGEPLTKATVVEKRYAAQELSKCNVLLVEDNKLNVKLIMSLFSEYDIPVKVAENGSEGIDKLRAEDFDIILMDMEMPVMNGYEAATFIRNELKSKVPIIAMTAHAMPGERERCLSLGMNDYISKPLNASLLFEKIAHLVLDGGKSLTDEFDINESNVIEIKVCDFRYLTEMMGAKNHLIRGIMEEFLEQIPHELSNINEAVAKVNYSLVRSLAHNMISSVSTMNISILVPILEEMEELGKKSIDIGRIRQLTKQLNLICAKAMAEVEEEMLSYS